MFTYCKCKNCGETFMDMFGEFKTDNGEIKCPICHKTDMLLNKDIKNFKKQTFKCYNNYVKKY